MKMILTAIAMTIATPAFAQTAAPADAHVHHDMTNHAGHEDHGKAGDCCADGTMACCQKARGEGKAPACCDKHAGKDGKAEAHAGHDKH